jgi:hypothetical protein
MSSSSCRSLKTTVAGFSTTAFPGGNPRATGQNPGVDPPQVSLLRWLRRQLREPSTIREHLEAAVANDDPAEARRLIAGLPFTDGQRRNVEQLLEAWERRGR